MALKTENGHLGTYTTKSPTSQNPSKPQRSPPVKPHYLKIFLQPANMSSAAAARSLFRSTASARSAVARFSGSAKPKGAARSPFRVPTQKPLSSRIFRSPVEMSCVRVDSMFPFHAATASALLTSMLSVTPRCYGWTPEDCKDDV
ncbi:protein NUCLEAR FUSION DEFECTIVE 6, mitochondrial-like isoform X1 [Diospyros lotus]|uniref:protein NUCLEAR FUSION DEFECTIVE 6, mitochondrial-like isoform X1 n=1 Tax=Diospyros lotus TaxID=55363 RepID=UPI00224E0DAD|nr:protein NUCLEAR FUSION DEFECTIVE 6, mitochondrial-like isoform X1 [Diospyros lotus]